MRKEIVTVWLKDFSSEGGAFIMKKAALVVAIFILLLPFYFTSNIQAQTIRPKPSSHTSARKKLNEALEKVRKQPTSSEAYITLGNAYARLRKVDEAIAAFKQAIRLKPDDEEAYFSLGQFYDWLAAISKEESKQWNQYSIAAIETYKQIVRIKPDAAKAHLKLGQSYQTVNRNDEAIEAFRIAIGLDSSDDRAYYYLGEIYLEKVQKAKQSYKLDLKAIKNNYSENLKSAVDAFLQSVRIKPDAFTYMKLGEAYQLWGEYNDAIEAYKSSFYRVIPSKEGILKEIVESQIYDHLLDIFIETNDLTRGEENLKQLIRDNPNSGYAHYALGRLYIRSGNKSAALQEYKILKMLKPSNLANHLFHSIYR